MKIIKNAIDVSDLDEFIYKALPSQGCVEIQNDAAGKEHTWHQHPNDETILILNGGLSFYADNIEQKCYAGDAVLLPMGTRHGSIALETGAVYMISFQFLEFLS
jgi:mannose-6-phosphate isomerase-like protein (cupin superfamily)